MTRLCNLLSAFVLIGAVSGSHASPISNIYVLGDSLSDQGNLKAATNTLAPPEASLPDALHYFNGRFSNGPVYTDYLSQALGLPLGPSFFGGNNFAYGGARTNYNVVEVQAGGQLPNGLFPWSLNGEVQDFRNRNINDPNGLYIVFSGSNDVADIVRRGLNPATAVPVVVNGILNAIDAVQDAGAQRVVVANVADLGLTPAFLLAPPGAAAAATAVSALTNSSLHAALAGISGIEIVEFNLFRFLQELVANPSALGLTNVSAPCYTGFVLPIPAGTECGNPEDFLFWDVVHPTTQVHGAIAQALLFVIPEPSVLTLLILPMLWIGLRRGRSGATSRAAIQS